MSDDLVVVQTRRSPSLAEGHPARAIVSHRACRQSMQSGSASQKSTAAREAQSGLASE